MELKELVLPLKAEYFNEIKNGYKPEEFRLCTPYWRKRLEGKTYRNIILTLGYPKKDDQERRMVIPWNGYKVKTIQHKHFGPDPVEVFAIDVSAAIWLIMPDLEVVRTKSAALGITI